VFGRKKETEQYLRSGLREDYCPGGETGAKKERGCNDLRSESMVMGYKRKGWPKEDERVNVYRADGDGG